jgi:hypothetical protein
MRGVAIFVIALTLTALPLPVSGQTSTDDRLRALEDQLRQALKQLGEQRDATQRAQQEIGELRRELKQQRVQAPTAAPGVAPAPGAVTQAPSAIDQRIEEKVRSEMARSQEETRQKQATLEQQVAQMKPAWDDYARRFLDKFRISTLFYGDWAYYQKTGFGPQFLTQINPPGPGNDNFNSFDITRAYINLFFTPSEDFTFRLTPNIFRAVGSPSGDKSGKTGGVGSNLDGNLTYRLKYAYIDWNTPFARLQKYLPAVAPIAEDKLTFGQQPNPLVDWEENLYGYRFTSLTPWNYLSLSSTFTGIAAKGPIKFGERQFVDYDFGVYNNSNFHQTEQSETKSGMGRVSVYPLGARSRFDGLGITGFYDYGYPNKTPDSGVVQHLSRLAALVHYTTDWWGIAGEYDQGHNAFSSNNLFSGSGPADQFGAGKTQFAAFDSMVKAIQDNQSTTQQGFDVLGHVDIPSTPFSVFGLYEWFLPNTKVGKNPLDFQRYVAGFGYRYSKYLRFALDLQDLDYYHGQFEFPKSFGLKSGVKDAVPDDIRAVFLNVEFNY